MKLQSPPTKTWHHRPEIHNLNAHFCKNLGPNRKHILSTSFCSLNMLPSVSLEVLSGPIRPMGNFLLHSVPPCHIKCLTTGYIYFYHSKNLIQTSGYVVVMEYNVHANNLPSNWQDSKLQPCHSESHNYVIVPEYERRTRKTTEDCLDYKIQTHKMI